MFPIWRLKLREVQVAAQSGRYDEAAVLLERESLREFLPAKRLAQDVAGKIVARAGERFARGDSVAGWQDLAVADRLGGQSEAIGQLRGQYTERAFQEVVRYLAAGQPAAAITRLEKLERKGLLGDRGRNFRQIAQLMLEADRAAAHGHFAAARAALGQAIRLTADDRSAAADRIGDGTMNIQKQLDERDQQAAEREADAQRLAAELHASLTGQDWSTVLSMAEALLAIAPQHQAALQARRRAWKAVGMDVTQAYQGQRSGGRVSLQLGGPGGRRSTRPVSRSSEVDTVFGSERPQRMLLWIDAVGGFLVSLDDQVVLGQPSPGQPIAVPILADLSRRHAVIRRESGAYVLEPIQSVSVDGRPLTGPVVLADGQLIELGESVRLRFRKPHALSATARLDIESRHKTQPSADAVLLLAESCVLGPNTHCHIRCRDWQHDVVLYRQGDRICCRSSAALSVDGEERSGAIEIGPHERVEGADFSFSWEEIQ
jgi:hypothetical protein